MTRLLCLLLLCGCSTISHKTVDIPQGCHVNAVAARDAIAKTRWARVLVVSYYSSTTKHAFCAYEHANAIYVYDDRSGSWRVSHDLSLKDSAQRLTDHLPPAKSGYYE